MRIPWVYVGAAAAVAGALIYVKMVGPKNAGAAAGAAAVDFADGVLSGVVLGIGDAVGVPRTEPTECQRAKAEGRTWDASFACPAGDFLGYLWD